MLSVSYENKKVKGEMMKLELFNDFIQALRLLYEREREIKRLGADLCEFSNLLNNVTKPLIEALFREDQREIIDWWLYDCPSGIDGDPKVCHMWDEEDRPIHLRNAAELHAYLMNMKEPLK